MSLGADHFTKPCVETTLYAWPDVGGHFAGLSAAQDSVKRITVVVGYRARCKHTVPTIKIYVESFFRHF